jgi:signal transduction histidine kinase
MNQTRAFLKSKSGQGFVLFLLVCAILSAAVGFSTYSSSLSWFTAHKTEEKVTALGLVDAFVTNYSDIRAKPMAQAPVPATFRAHSIELFNKQNKDAGLENFHLLWVGRQGRAIATPPADDQMAKTIESFATAPEPKAHSEFTTINGELVFRTVYPSFAHQQSCVDCHNQLQPEQHWKLHDLMGAFSIDVPASPFLAASRMQSIAWGLAVFFAFGVVGLAIAIMHFRQIAEREATQIAVERELVRRVEERTAELREAQNELLRKERLSTLGQLTATVAHELRNPLSAIRNSIFPIKQKVGADPDLERPLDRVVRNIQRCDRIITDLLDFTRFRELARTDVDADQWLADTLNEQKPPDGITLRRQLNARCKISLDPERMRRVVINLVENSAQAMAEGGSDGKRQITVSTEAKDGQFELVVEDTGPGIPKDILSKVFEPLFSTKGFGTGLGLPTVKQIVEQHGGGIDIASEVGKGTRVTVRLPLAAAGNMAA